MINMSSSNDSIQLEYFIDDPQKEDVVSSGFWISGWVIERFEKVKGVSIRLSDLKLTEITEFESRPDVEKSFPDYKNSLKSGFQFFCKDVPLGKYTLRFYAIINNHEVLFSSKKLRVLPPYSKEQLSKKMSDEWDKRAIEDAEKYIFNKGPICSSRYEELSQVQPLLVLELLKGYEHNFKTENSKMLEIGCGIGRLGNIFAESFENYIGIDVSKKMIERAQKFCSDKKNVKFFTNNGFDLDFIDSNSIDFVFEAYVFQHIPDKDIVRNYCKESLRVLKPGGIFLGLFLRDDINRVNVPSQFKRVEGLSITNETLFGVSFNKDEISQMFKDTGFNGIEFHSGKNFESTEDDNHHIVIAKA